MRARPALALTALTAFTLGATSWAATPAPAAVSGHRAHTGTVHSAVKPPVTVVSGLKGPVSFAAVHGKLTIAAAGAGRLTRVNTDGTAPEALFTTSPRTVVGSVESAGPGTSFTQIGTVDGRRSARLMRLTGDGRTKTVASLSGYEAAKNPDRTRTYGIIGLSKGCASKLPAALGKGTYTGKVRSFPVASALLPDNSIVVVDRGANDVLRVTKKGAVSLVAVLPAQSLSITPAVATLLKLPVCTVGHVDRFEAVPTDVEVAKGQVYVTTYAGGSQDVSLGARGKVYRISPSSHKVTLVAGGFSGPTNLAIDADGSGAIYVAEPTSGRISTVTAGVRAPFVDLPAAGSLEWSAGKLFATTVPAGGSTTSIVSISR